MAWKFPPGSVASASVPGITGRRHRMLLYRASRGEGTGEQMCSPQESKCAHLRATRRRGEWERGRMIRMERE